MAVYRSDSEPDFEELALRRAERHFDEERQIRRDEAADEKRIYGEVD